MGDNTAWFCDDDDCGKTIWWSGQAEHKCPDCGESMARVMHGGGVPYFAIDDKCMEQYPMWNRRGRKVKNVFTYYALQAAEAMCRGLGEVELGPDDVIHIRLKTIDDGKRIYYKVVGRLTVERKD